MTCWMVEGSPACCGTGTGATPLDARSYAARDWGTIASDFTCSVCFASVASSGIGVCVTLPHPPYRVLHLPFTAGSREPRPLTFATKSSLSWIASAPGYHAVG